MTIAATEVLTVRCLGCGDPIRHTSVEPRDPARPDEDRFDMILGPPTGYELTGYATGTGEARSHHCWRCFPRCKPWG